MSEHEFTLKLDGDLLFEKFGNDAFEAGFDDVTISMRNGTVYLMFDREAPTREEAIASAIECLKGAGYVATLEENDGEGKEV